MKCIALVLVFVSVAAAWLAPLHVTSGEKEKDRYIVHFKSGIAGEYAFENIVTQLGGRILRRYTHVLNGVSLELTAEAVDRIRLLDIIELVEEDGIARINSDDVSSWGLDRINQRQLPLDSNSKHQGTGKGVHVYILDTGINAAHKDFEGRVHISKEMDMYGGTGEDCKGHGTHCAGIVGSKTYGVAPGVELYSVRVLKCNGAGAYSDIIAGMDWVATNHTTPAIASISIGGVWSPTMNTAAIRLVNAGVTTVVAAGNENTNACFKSPASAKEVITVGASNQGDTKPTFSNFGSCVDIFAPGKAIVSTFIDSGTETDTVKSLSGTSMAAPHVAGAAALILADSRTKTPAEVKNQIISEGTPGNGTLATGSPNLLLYIP
ncbi:aqualysin-1-like [Antedon mediterranea]|uniref:aqualysin-1-like n=1 Tax=Antedon mediterranea TaxID=105859 RepID=UPI003AF59F4A